VQQKLTLGGDGGGIFEVDSRDGATLTVHQMTAEGPRAAEVADALAGRAQIAAALPDLPADSRAALSLLADFSQTPAEALAPPENRCLSVADMRRPKLMCGLPHVGSTFDPY